MASGVTLKGFGEFQDKLEKLPKELIEEADFLVKDAAALWEERAKQDAPVDQGRLRQQISSFKRDSGNWEIVSASDYSAFLEWGTKTKVRVPAELVSYAMQFKGITRPGGAKAIYEWCRRVGIPQNVWVFVYLSIMRYGVTPHPFFFHQAPIVEKQLMDDLKQLIEAYD